MNSIEHRLRVLGLTRFIHPAALYRALVVIFGLFLAHPLWSYTVVTLSTAAPQGLENTFIASTTNQFAASLFVNPLASNTYGIKLFGPNPSYNAPEPPPSNLEQALSLGATVYVYGFANGMRYQQNSDNNLVESFDVKCSSVPIGFSTATWSTGTCHAVAEAIDSAVFQESLSTPTVIPPTAGGF